MLPTMIMAYIHGSVMGACNLPGFHGFSGPHFVSYPQDENRLTLKPNLAQILRGPSHWTCDGWDPLRIWMKYPHPMGAAVPLIAMASLVHHFWHGPYMSHLHGGPSSFILPWWTTISTTIVTHSQCYPLLPMIKPCQLCKKTKLFLV